MKKVQMLIMMMVLVCAPAVIHAALGDAKSIEGTVKDVGMDSLTVTAQSPDQMKMSEAQIQTDTQTQFQGISKLTDLKEGDKVKVDYRDDASKKIATVVMKESSDSAAGTISSSTSGVATNSAGSETSPAPTGTKSY